MDETTCDLMLPPYFIGLGDKGLTCDKRRANGGVGGSQKVVFIRKRWKGLSLYFVMSLRYSSLSCQRVSKGFQETGGQIIKIFLL